MLKYNYFISLSFKILQNKKLIDKDMKKIFFALLFIMFVGGAYAQMPVILESQYQKLVEEAKTKKNDEGSTFRASNRTKSDDEQVTDDNQSQSDQVDNSSATTTEEKSGSSTKKSSVSNTSNDDSSSSNSNSDYVKKYRERQKKIKSGKK